MFQDQISKEESGDILDQRVHVVTTNQELRHSTRKVVRLTGDYLGPDGPPIQAMGTWYRHIYRFKRQFDKAFARNRLFEAKIVDRIHKRVQVFLQSCNMTSLNSIKTGALLRFGELQRRVDKGEWVTYHPTWVELPSQKED